MIRSTFLVLDRLGKTREKSIWAQGILTWDDFLNSEKISGISPKSKTWYDRQLKKISGQLYSNNSSFFSGILPLSETWRLYRFFSEEAVFLDIETSGVEKKDDITVFGLFDGIDTKLMIRGINLDYGLLKEALKEYKIIVTFNGASFDIPFTKKRYPGLIPDIPHIDLRHVCEKVGLTGGLTEIERKIGIQRNKIIDRLYGGDVLLLWKMFRATGDKHYLDLLVEYNEDDVINLKTIADLAIPELEKRLKGNLF
jgi:uncharacterized protein